MVVEGAHHAGGGVEELGEMVKQAGIGVALYGTFQLWKVLFPGLLEGNAEGGVEGRLGGAFQKICLLSASPRAICDYQGQRGLQDNMQVVSTWRGPWYLRNS